MKVAFITTVNHNVGDDFVRDGILYLLTRTVGPVEPALIHKHFPLSVRSEWDWLHRSGFTRVMDRIPHSSALGWSRLIDRLPLRAAGDKILNSELLVQCGAPVYWLNAGSNSASNEWYEPLVCRRWKRVRTRVPFLNIGAGSCQAYHSDGSEFSTAPGVLAYIRELHARCALTTVRDHLSKSILAMAGVDAPLLPCPSLFACKQHAIDAGSPEYVALNYMKLGGHYRLDGAIDPLAWRKTFVAFARHLARSDRCVLVCHDRMEREEAGKMLPEFDRFYSNDYREYLRVYARASCGVVNRVHAAFVMASFGRPALVVGNDSRARMTELIDLPHLHVAEASVERLQSGLEVLRNDASVYAAGLARICDQAQASYLRLLTSVLGRQ